MALPLPEAHAGTPGREQSARLPISASHLSPPGQDSTHTSLVTLPSLTIEPPPPGPYRNTPTPPYPPSSGFSHAPSPDPSTTVRPPFPWRAIRRQSSASQSGSPSLELISPQGELSQPVFPPLARPRLSNPRQYSLTNPSPPSALAPPAVPPSGRRAWTTESIDQSRRDPLSFHPGRSSLGTAGQGAATAVTAAAAAAAAAAATDGAPAPADFPPRPVLPPLMGRSALPIAPFAHALFSSTDPEPSTVAGHGHGHGRDFGCEPGRFGRSTTVSFSLSHERDMHHHPQSREGFTTAVKSASRPVMTPTGCGGEPRRSVPASPHLSLPPLNNIVPFRRRRSTSSNATRKRTASMSTSTSASPSPGVDISTRARAGAYPSFSSYPAWHTYPPPTLPPMNVPYHHHPAYMTRPPRYGDSSLAPGFNFSRRGDGFAAHSCTGLPASSRASVSSSASNASNAHSTQDLGPGLGLTRLPDSSSHHLPLLTEWHTSPPPHHSSASLRALALEDPLLGLQRLTLGLYGFGTYGPGPNADVIPATAPTPAVSPSYEQDQAMEQPQPQEDDREQWQDEAEAHEDQQRGDEFAEDDMKLEKEEKEDEDKDGGKEEKEEEREEEGKQVVMDGTWEQEPLHKKRKSKVHTGGNDMSARPTGRETRDVHRAHNQVEERDHTGEAVVLASISASTHPALDPKSKFKQPELKPETKEGSRVSGGTEKRNEDGLMDADGDVNAVANPNVDINAEAKADTAEYVDARAQADAKAGEHAPPFFPETSSSAKRPRARTRARGNRGTHAKMGSLSPSKNQRGGKRGNTLCASQSHEPRWPKAVAPGAAGSVSVFTSARSDITAPIHPLHPSSVSSAPSAPLSSSSSAAAATGGKRKLGRPRNLSRDKLLTILSSSQTYEMDATAPFRTPKAHPDPHSGSLRTHANDVPASRSTSGLDPEPHPICHAGIALPSAPTSVPASTPASTSNCDLGLDDGTGHRTGALGGGNPGCRGRAATQRGEAIATFSSRPGSCDPHDRQINLCPDVRGADCTHHVHGTAGSASCAGLPSLDPHSILGVNSELGAGPGPTLKAGTGAGSAGSGAGSGSAMSVCTYLHPLTGEYCGVQCNRLYDLARHRETIHARDEARAIESGQLTMAQALVWGKEVDPASSRSVMREWVCHACESVFSRKDALLRHKRLRNH